jgi:hypothetical protein
LIDGHRLTGNAALLQKAEQILTRVVHPEEDIRKHRLDDPEQRWFYTMFLQSLGKYLRYKVERREVDAAYAYGKASLLHYARWMAEHEVPYLQRPEKLEFPTETWAAQDIRKSDVFYYAWLHAPDAERPRFAERGRFFHQYSVEALGQMATRTLARPVIVLLTSGFLHGWVAAHPVAAEPQPFSHSTFSPQKEFVPQRTRAKRKLVGLAAGVVTAMCVAGLWMAFR